MTDLVVKRGASLQLSLQFNNDDGTPMPLAGLTLSAQVRTIYGELIDTLTLTQTGTPGQISVLQATDDWPTGRHACDVKIGEPDATLKSDTMYILVSEAVTA